MKRLWLWAREIRWLAVLALIAAFVGLLVAIIACAFQSLLFVLIGLCIIADGLVLATLDNRR